MFVSNIGFAVMHIAHLVQTDKLIIGWVVCSVISFSVVKNLIIAVKAAGSSFIEGCRRWKRRRQAKGS